MKQTLATQNTIIINNDKHKITTHTIAKIVLPIFNSHIGATNSITKKELFKKIYKKPLENNNLADWVRWEYLRKAMHHLRLKSNCFIVGIRGQYDYEFFIPRTEAEAQLYIKHLNNNIMKMRQLQARAIQSVRQEWYKQEFNLKTKKKALQ